MRASFWTIVARYRDRERKIRTATLASSSIPAGEYLIVCPHICFSTYVSRYFLKSDSMKTSVASAWRGMVSFRGSGRNTQGIFRLKRRVAACTTVRGKVASPTHHQVRRNEVLKRSDMLDGSRAESVEKIRATRLAWG
jgi:hypothetical protein